MYKANSKAWMTQDLFTGWLQKFDDEMVAQKRRVVLILDNSTADNVQPKLLAINLKLLPANSTAKSQPLDQGVIATVKALYKTRICEKVVAFATKGTPQNKFESCHRHGHCILVAS